MHRVYALTIWILINKYIGTHSLEREISNDQRLLRPLAQLVLQSPLARLGADFDQRSLVKGNWYWGESNLTVTLSNLLFIVACDLGNPAGPLTSVDIDDTDWEAPAW